MIGEPVVTIFGGSAAKEGDVVYQQSVELGCRLAKAGFVIATGGYIGSMEAVSKGAAEAGGYVIGVTCDQIEKWRGVKPNQWVSKEIRCQSLRERVYRLIEIGKAILALPGGVGTLSELALSWSLLQTGELSPRPLIVVGNMWQDTLGIFFRMANDFLRPRDAEYLTFAKGVDEALDHLIRYLKHNPI